MKPAFLILLLASVVGGCAMPEPMPFADGWGADRAASMESGAMRDAPRADLPTPTKTPDGGVQGDAPERDGLLDGTKVEGGATEGGPTEGGPVEGGVKKKDVGSKEKG